MCGIPNTSMANFLEQVSPGVFCALIAVLLAESARVIHNYFKLRKRKEVILKALHRETIANIKEANKYIEYGKSGASKKDEGYAGLALSCECCIVIIHDPDLSHAVGKEVFAKTLETPPALNAVKSRLQIKAKHIRLNMVKRFKKLSEELEKSIPKKFKDENATDKEP